MSEYQYEPNYVKSNLRQLENDTVVTLKDTKILVPALYRAKEMLSIGTKVSVIGIHCIMMDNKYAVNMTCAMVGIEPMATNIIKVDGEEYYEFSFPAGSVLYPNVNVVMSDDNPYNIFDVIYDKGNRPFYIDYILLGKLLSTAKYFTGTSYGANPNIAGIIASHMSRDPEDKNKYHRHRLKTQQDVSNLQPSFIAFSNVLYGPSNVTSALLGNYFRDAKTSALLRKSEREEPMENILGS